MIRGENLFEQNVFEIVVQTGSMVGVEKEERASTPCSRISRIIGYGGELRRQCVFGTLIAILLKKTGADPATASSIFLTTATDAISMGLLLDLASVLVL